MPQEPKDDRSVLRSLLTAAATGAGVVGGAGLGAGAGVASGRKIMSRGRKAMLHGISNPIDAPLPHGRGTGTMKILHKALGSGAKALSLRALLGAAVGAGAGGVGAYQLAKRKKTAMDTPTKEQLLQALKGIGKATAGGAGIGGLVGAGIGAVGSNPDPERGRLVHILRMMLKGGAVGGGITAGALTGGLGAGVAAKGIGEGAGMSRGNTAKLTSGATLGGALMGGGAGGALGAKLGAEKRAALTYILRSHKKQALLADIKLAVAGR